MHRLRRRSRRSAVLPTPAPQVLLLLAVLCLLPAASAQAQSGGEREVVARAQEMIDAERPQEALDLLDPYLKRHPDDAAALLARSTVRFMLGDVAAGRRDLDRSLKLEPTQRQGWLNQAALAVSEERYDDALAAFRRAETLDPAAPENDLNIGTVLLLKGQLEAASERFESYLGGAGDSADGYYLVASNYALAGYAALAIEHLRRAIERNERARLRARTDPNFSTLATNRRFLALLSTDSYQPPVGSHAARRSFGAPYDGGRGPLLPAVLDALQLGERPFDPRVEVTESWALVWGDLRIKLYDSEGRGVVELSAPAERFTPAEWQTATQDLLSKIAQRAALRQSKRSR
jgi:tetratricopeptide (TPR) repeat protein